MIDPAMHMECIVTGEELASGRGLHTAIHFVCNYCQDGPTVVAALASVISEYLRQCPVDLRGRVADHLCELLKDDVRRSLQ
jgi:hypothetical protein